VFKVRRLTFLIIPEEGGRTHEFKIPRIVAWLAGIAGIALLFLLGAGFIAISKEQDLQRLVAELVREKGVLKEDLGLLTELEVLLKDLEQSNGQLRRVLSQRPEANESSSPSRGGPQIEHYVPSVDRLLAGLVRTVPTLWPVRGVPVGGAFSPNVGGIIVAAPIGSLVRASAAGTVLRAGYDVKLGYVVVLDHGNRLSTEYGYNTSILVEAGEFVQKGQPLALSGSGVDVNQAGLFFGVHENGKPRNPLAYRIWL
jgi:murein DD-endopeptidase MepM/ murein hydrolase activator NlpD